MNRYMEYEGFLGAYVPENRGSVSDVLECSVRLRKMLGGKGYLLDSYLTRVLRGAGGFPAREAAQAGEDAYARLVSLCRKVIEGDDAQPDSGFSRTVRKFMLEHPLKLQVPETRVQYFASCLSEDYLGREAVQDFILEHKKRMVGLLDIVALQNSYEELSWRAGGQVMEELDIKAAGTFLYPPAMKVFLQAYAEALLKGLLFRDDETGRTILQLRLDRWEPGQSLPGGTDTAEG